jgi:hypothetical protein
VSNLLRNTVLRLAPNGAGGLTCNRFRVTADKLLLEQLQQLAKLRQKNGSITARMIGISLAAANGTYSANVGARNSNPSTQGGLLIDHLHAALKTK